MTDLVEYLVRKVVDQPDQVSVTPFEDEYGTVLEVRVAPTDMGKVIGRGGRVVNAIRTVVKSVAIRDNVNCVVEIMEPEAGVESAEGQAESAPAPSA